MMDGTDTVTTFHFILMAVLAILVVIGIVAGMRLKRGRVNAQREVENHAAEAGVEPEQPAEDEPVATPAPPPLPPLVSDQPISDTPPAAEEVVSERPSADESLRERPLADEPIVAVAPDGTTAAVAIEPAVAKEPSPADGPLTQVKGLGPRVAARLAELGIERVGQLAVLDRHEAEAVDAQLGSFTGRMERDRWLEQARLLAAGDRDGFERTFGKL